MQWQYLVHAVPADVISSKAMRPRELEGILNRYGGEGCELVGAFATTDGSDVIVLRCKRQADADTAPPSHAR